MYVYDNGITDELIETIANEPKICKYIDMPIQHVSDRVLHRMRRQSTGSSIRQTITKLRDRIPDVHVRTTLLVGFPGETEEDMAELLDFIDTMHIDRLGAFAFSDEEGTPSYELDGKLDEETKEDAAEEEEVDGDSLYPDNSGVSLKPASYNEAAPDWTEYTELIAQIKTETDTEKRVALMHHAEDILMATGAVIPIYYYNDLYLQKTDVEGIYSNLFGFKFFQFATCPRDVLKVNLASEPAKIDPALNSSVDGACLDVNLFAGLYTYDADGNLQPDLADPENPYEVSDDGLVYTFHLLDGLKWSDGTDVTAKDFEYAWKRCADPKTAADYAYMFDCFALADDGTINVAPYPTGANPKFSRIHTFSLVVPLQIHVSLGRSWYLSFGPELYFNTYASLKTRYSLNGESQKIEANRLHRNKVTYGLMCDITYSRLGVYFKYSPCNVMQTEFGPKFKSITAGVRLAF